MDREAVNIKIRPKVKKDFRLRCLVADHTMQSAVDWFIAEVNRGAIKLPVRSKE